MDTNLRMYFMIVMMLRWGLTLLVIFRIYLRDYSVLINQRRGSASCDYLENYTISAPSNPLSATSVLVQDYTCIQEAIIEAQNIAGGTAPYSYSIDGVNFIPDTTPNANRFENLTDGTYTITVRDAAGCILPTPPITIDPLNEPTNLTFTATAPFCPALTSDVTVTVVDGNPSFIYEIIAPAGDVVNNGNSNLFNALDPGTYTFRATDTKGCSIEEDFTISPINRINVIGQLDSNISCFGASDGEATFNITNFNTTYDYTVTGPSTFSGVTQSAGSIPFTGLSAGVYTITVTDNETSCTDTVNVEVQSPTAALALAANPSQPTCISDGDVTLTATDGWGGYNYELFNPDTTSFGINTTGAFFGLTQTGTYTATVTDANGCIVNTTFVLDPATAPVLAISPNQDCYDDAVLLTLTATVTSGGDGNFEYSLNGGPFGNSNVFSGLSSGTYTIDVRDGKNCTGTQTITIDPELTITASAGITACGMIRTSMLRLPAATAAMCTPWFPVGRPVSGDFSATNPVTLTGIPAAYDVYVRDNNAAM